jgi:hypothetical protein
MYLCAGLAATMLLGGSALSQAQECAGNDLSGDRQCLSESPSPEHEAKLVCTSLKNGPREDIIKLLSYRKDLARIAVLHKKGIGAARLHFQTNYRPKMLEIEFTRFSNLESFAVESAQQQLNTNLKRALAAREARLRSAAPEQVQELAAIPHNDIEMRKLKNGAIKVEICCTSILGPDGDLTLSWIDCYR